MHLSDGILPGPILVGGFITAAAMARWGAGKMQDAEIPRVAVFTAAFFCASLIHFRVPPTSVHLLFHGLLGVVLGRRALVAIPIGLGLQAALLGHGGITTLGVNATLFGIAAMVGAGIYRVVAARAPAFAAGSLAATGAVLVSGMLLAGVLWSLGEGFRWVANYVFIAHLPVLGIEAVVTGFTVEFLKRVQPALLPGGATGGAV